MKNIIFIILVFVNLIFAYENITIQDGYSFIYKENNTTNSLHNFQIYINHYDENNNSEKKTLYYGHIFTQGNIYHFLNATLNEDENKSIFSLKNSNISIKASIKDDTFKGKIKLNGKIHDINATLDKKYSLIMIKAKANFNKISKREFAFKKSFVYDFTNFKDQNSSIMRFKMANLLKNSYFDELSTWYNEFFGSDDIDFDSPIFIRYSDNLENIYYKNGDLVVFLNDVYFYSGGAHDNVIKIYEVNYKDKKLTLSDILKDEKNQTLLNMIWDKIKSYAYIKQSDLFVSSNFTVSPYGVTFVYSPYEIAPFSAGILEVFFKFSEIKPFLKDSFLNLL